MFISHFRFVVLVSQWLNSSYIPTNLTFYDGVVLNDGYYDYYLVLSPVCGLRCFRPLKPLHFGWDNCVKSSLTYPNRSVQNCPTCLETAAFTSGKNNSISTIATLFLISFQESIIKSKTLFIYCKTLFTFISTVCT